LANEKLLYWVAADNHNQHHIFSMHLEDVFISAICSTLTTLCNFAPHKLMLTYSQGIKMSHNH